MSEFKKPVRPVGTRLLIKVDTVEKKTAGGIVLIEDFVEKESARMESGTVIDIGSCAFSGYGNGKPWCQKGDHVYFLPHAGRILKLDGDDYRIINDLDLIAVTIEDNKDEIKGA